jgi:hypothetical protein
MPGSPFVSCIIVLSRECIKHIAGRKKAGTSPPVGGHVQSGRCPGQPDPERREYLTPHCCFFPEGAKMSSGTGNWSPVRCLPGALYTLPHIQRNDTCMTAIPRKYITDAKNQKQAVIVDLETFNRMESIIEDNGLAKFMEEAEEDETLTVHEAKKHYRSLKKG